MGKKKEIQLLKVIYINTFLRGKKDKNADSES